MRRAEDTFSAKRNSVIKRSAVGNTLNSTGRVMYMAPIKTITDIEKLALINRSSTIVGIGAIIASTMPRTASGTEISLQLTRDRNPMPDLAEAAVTREGDTGERPA